MDRPRPRMHFSTCFQTGSEHLKNFENPGPMKNLTKVCVYSIIGCLLAGSLHLLADSISPLGAGKYPAELRKTAKDSKKADAKKEEDKKKPYGDEKPFNDVVKDMEVTKGLFTFYRKADEKKIYI